MLLSSHAEVNNPVDQIVLAGVFAVSTRDYVNFATCLAYQGGTYCAKELPQDDDTWLPVDPWDETIDDPLETVDIGTSFRLGPFQANRVERDGFTVYFNQNLAPFGPVQDGTLSLEWEGGAWGDYHAEDVVPAPDPIEVLDPDPTRRHTLSNGTFPLRWTPGVVGDVFLSVESPTVQRLFRLEDDGAHDLDVDALGLTDGEEVTLTLGRWSVVRHLQQGNEIDVLVQDVQVLRTEYRDLSNRTEISGGDGCAQALYEPPLTSGRYWGRLSNNTNQLSAGQACGNGGSGPEQVYRASLNDGGQIDISYAIFNTDASLYLMTGCGNLDTCLDGSDVNGNGIESVFYTNESGGPQDLFVVLDSNASPVTDLFLLDVDIIDIFPSPLVDACADALYQTPLTSFPPGTDRYVGDITTFHNYADPAGGCMTMTSPGVTAPGAEGMVKIELAPFEAVEATVTMPGADPSLYLLYNCANSASCASGSDLSTSDTETVSYTNQSGVNEVLYLVVDSQGGSGSFTLDVLIQ